MPCIKSVGDYFFSLGSIHRGGNCENWVDGRILCHHWEGFKLVMPLSPPLAHTWPLSGVGTSWPSQPEHINRILAQSSQVPQLSCQVNLHLPEGSTNSLHSFGLRPLWAFYYHHSHFSLRATLSIFEGAYPDLKGIEMAPGDSHEGYLGRLISADLADFASRELRRCICRPLTRLMEIWGQCLVTLLPCEYPFDQYESFATVLV